MLVACIAFDLNNLPQDTANQCVYLLQVNEWSTKTSYERVTSHAQRGVSEYL